jgi:hypothetical protein
MQNETTPAPADDLASCVSNGQMESDDFGPVGDAARQIASYCDGGLSRLNVYRSAKARIQSDAEKIATLEAQNKTLRGVEAMLMEAVERIEAGDLDQRTCCDGHMCGCQGSTNADQFLHFARQILAATEPQA